MLELFTFSITDLWIIGTILALFLIWFIPFQIRYGRPLRTAKKKNKNVNEVDTESLPPLPPVSVIIYSGGKPQELETILPSVLSQEYPDYEVIVVNDGGDDDTNDVIKRFSNEHKNLKSTFTPQNARYLSRKKLAFTLGIKAAQNEILLMLESDGNPISSNWIKSMVRNYTSDTEIVLGFAAYPENKKFRDKLIAYDRLIDGLRYISAAIIHKPYSADGRNLSYRKSLFLRRKGYYEWLDLKDGEDDLFINSAANEKNTAVEYSSESLTSLAPYPDFKEWTDERIERLATSTHYRNFGPLAGFKVISFNERLSVLADIAAIVIYIFGNWLISILAGLLLIARCVVKYRIFYRSSRMLQQKSSVGYLPILEIVRPVVNLYLRFYHLLHHNQDYTFQIDNEK